MTQNNGLFTLASPGTYQVTAILNTPPCTQPDTADTDVFLMVNGTPLPATQTHVRCGTQTTNTMLQAHVVSDGTTTIALSADTALNYNANRATDVLASITFLRLM